MSVTHKECIDCISRVRSVSIVCHAKEVHPLFAMCWQYSHVFFTRRKFSHVSVTSKKCIHCLPCARNIAMCVSRVWIVTMCLLRVWSVVMLSHA